MKKIDWNTELAIQQLSERFKLSPVYASSNIVYFQTEKNDISSLEVIAIISEIDIRKPSVFSSLSVLYVIKNDKDELKKIMFYSSRRFFGSRKIVFELCDKFGGVVAAYDLVWILCNKPLSGYAYGYKGSKMPDPQDIIQFVENFYV